MKNVIKFGGIIGVADHIKFQFLSRLQKGMFDFRFENGDFLSCKGMELCLDFRIVDNRDFQSVIF